jgi:hypothetical protein
MQPTCQPITASVLDRILIFLAPLFLGGAEGDLQAARLAAAETLRAYAARNEQELHLAAQVIAFSLRSLDALARAAAPDLDIKTLLRLNSSAATLHRAAMRAQKELDRLRAQPLMQEEIPAAELPELLTLAVSVQDAPAGTPKAEPAPSDNAPPRVPALSRQQRRLAERLAERERRRQPDRVRPDQAGPDQARQIERTLLSPRELEAAL